MVMPGNGNTASGASPRQGTIHAKPGNIVAALQLYRGLRQLVCLMGMVRFVQVCNHIMEDLHQGSVCPRLRDFHASRQSKAESSRQQTCFHGRVFGYWYACWLSWDSCSIETGPREDSWLDSAREPRKQHETEVLRSCSKPGSVMSAAIH
jgi:hypothetical protein